MNQSNIKTDEAKIIRIIDPIAEVEELLYEKQKYKNLISEELSKEYFESINSSVLPF
ncbi:MAG: hypothetical protein Q8R46_08070 [Nitrosomonas sp.]|nr:hypothetical protein [Nitrosomonas sp.]MDP3663349.1 hypothetical protein [Nitrosomonas sp.]